MSFRDYCASRKDGSRDTICSALLVDRKVGRVSPSAPFGRWLGAARSERRAPPHTAGSGSQLVGFTPWRLWLCAHLMPRVSPSIFGLVFTLLLATVPLAVRAERVVVFNEIMYHPLTNEAAFEWVELHNQMAVDVNLSGWSIDGGIHFTFPEGTVTSGGSSLVVAASPSDLMAATGPSLLVTDTLDALPQRFSRVVLLQ